MNKIWIALRNSFKISFIAALIGSFIFGLFNIVLGLAIVLEKEYVSIFTVTISPLEFFYLGMWVVFYLFGTMKLITIPMAGAGTLMYHFSCTDISNKENPSLKQSIVRGAVLGGISSLIASIPIVVTTKYPIFLFPSPTFLTQAISGFIIACIMGGIAGGNIYRKAQSDHLEKMRDDYVEPVFKFKKTNYLVLLPIIFIYLMFMSINIDMYCLAIVNLIFFGFLFYYAWFDKEKLLYYSLQWFEIDLFGKRFYPEESVITKLFIKFIKSRFYTPYARFGAVIGLPIFGWMFWELVLNSFKK